MVSRAGLRDEVRGWRWQAVRDALAARPDLIGARDDRGRNWLHLCCAAPPREGRVSDEGIRTADLLLALGLGIDDAAFTEGDWKATPLWHVIAWGRDLAIARHLLGRGACPLYCLYAATWNDDADAVRLLVANGAPVEGDSGPHETPLFAAAGWSRFVAAQALLEVGANPDFCNPKGDTALHLMLRKGSGIAHFRLFAAHGARGDIADAKGRTAAEILRRKRDPAFHAIADTLGG